MHKLGLENEEELEIKLPASFASQKKQGIPEKNICFIDYAIAFDYVDHNTLKNP